MSQFSHYAFLGLSAWSILSTIDEVRLDMLACLFVPSVYLFLTEQITHPATQRAERNPRESGRTETGSGEGQTGNITADHPDPIPWPPWPPRD